MSDGYFWVKAVHIMAVISWMAALLYLPRLYVYHCGAEAGSPASEMLKLMERRLLRQIMNPAMIVSYITGIWLALIPGIVDWSEGWPYAKLGFLVILTASHGLMAMWRREFAEDRNKRSHVFYRVANEVPTLLMIGIVIFVVVKPF